MAIIATRLLPRALTMRSGLRQSHRKPLAPAPYPRSTNGFPSGFFNSSASASKIAHFTVYVEVNMANEATPWRRTPNDHEPHSPPYKKQKTGGDHHTPQSPTSSDARVKLQPREQRERHVINRPKRDLAAEITHEKDYGNLPEGYLGTWNRMRFYSPEIDIPCEIVDARGLLHHLSCGHWVTTDERKPCGLNCHDPDFQNPPFKMLSMSSGNLASHRCPPT